MSYRNKAEPLLKRVLILREKVLGQDHVDAAESLVNLAVLNNKKVRSLSCVYFFFHLKILDDLIAGWIDHKVLTTEGII